MLEFVSGNMFDKPFDIRLNTVNIVGVMGKGVALAFKNRYPEMYYEYKMKCARKEIKIGELHIWKTSTEWIINFPTKLHWKDPSKLEYVEAGLIALRDYLLLQGSVNVAIPALGCGLGGLDFDDVKKLIEKYLKDVPANISMFQPIDSRTIK